MENLTVVSTCFWACLLANLSILLILFSNGKCNRCFNNYLDFDFSQFIHNFNFFSNGKFNRCFSNFWPCILANLSIVSMLFTNGKSNRCLNNFLAVHFSQAIHSFNPFFKLENLNVASTIVCPWTFGKLSIV